MMFFHKQSKDRFCFTKNEKEYQYMGEYKLSDMNYKYNHTEYVKDGSIVLLSPTCLGFWSKE